MIKSLKLTLCAVGLACAIPATLAQPSAGDWEFTLGGGGNADNKFRSGSAGISGSVAYFITPEFSAGFRQNLNFVGTRRGDEDWAGSTRIAADYHFLLGRFVPFIGATFGLDYTEDDSSWGIGPEVGLKYYVHEKTFVFVAGEYRWDFDRLSRVDNNADTGNFAFTIGVGFNIGGRR